jgi:acyl-CoA thioesterase FadM
VNKKLFAATVFCAIFSIPSASGQRNSQGEPTFKTAIPTPFYIWPIKLQNAAWTVTTDPKKPNVVKVTLDFRNLSVVQTVYDAQCTVRFIDRRTRAVQIETFSIDPLRGGKVYVTEFKTKLKLPDWTRVQVEAQKLDGNLQSHVEVYQEEKNYTPLSNGVS